jgi:hypothetical protein
VKHALPKMQKDEIPEQIKLNFLQILSVDQQAQKLAIENIYDEDCLLENPYLVQLASLIYSRFREETKLLDLMQLCQRITWN